MFKRLIFTGILCAATILSGCATRTKMALGDDAEKLTETSKPLLLLSVTLRNTYKTSHQPRLLVVNVEKPEAKDASDRLNFTMDEKASIESDRSESGNNYLLRLELNPGTYKIVGLISTSKAFLINGVFFTPLHSDVVVNKPGVFYLGHVSATVRERIGEEFKAGPSIPLLDQAVVGASGGTFDVSVSDEFETDEALFRSRFPALKGVVINKAVLPPFDRANAQAWWQTH